MKMRMTRHLAISLQLLIFLNSCATAISQSDPASLVNLFIGTINGGHVFPGVQVRGLIVHPLIYLL